ncbi:MAG TPA: FixH family protein [Tahibacter sp.]|uniref:FixH family protein n=1 Tax=Tahibacter sp. TaxID=2056211 RepID=UPI002C6B5AED|nr:FixH family protein [Tahibacter sp.]HSX59461.1 FixH family protein [Tahibacter sp.]
MNAPAASPRRAWREPMVWLVAGLPLLSIVAGVGLVVVAVRSGNVDALSGGVRRTAQVQAEDTHADEEALRRNLTGTLRRDANTVVVALHGDAGDMSTLRLRLLHPGAAARDVELTLERIAPRRWHAIDLPAAANAWNLRVEPEDGRWRLAGRLGADAADATLRPLWQR